MREKIVLELGGGEVPRELEEALLVVDDEQRGVVLVDALVRESRRYRLNEESEAILE